MRLQKVPASRDPTFATAASTVRSSRPKRSWTTVRDSAASRRDRGTGTPSSTFVSTIVLLMVRAAPMKRDSMGVRPKARATTAPTKAVRPTWIDPMSSAVGPAWKSFLGLNSRPTPNISRITPRSARVFTLCSSATRGTGTWGPTSMPAST